MSSQRPRILVAIGSLEVGGTERQITELCRGLSDEFEFHVVTHAPGGSLEPSVRASGAQLHSLVTTRSSPSRLRVQKRLRAALAVPRFRRLLAQIRPALIHAYLPDMAILATAARWPAASPPLVLSRRSLVRRIARGPAYLPIARWANAHADVLLANSHAVKQDVVAVEGVPPDRIEVILNGVDCDVFVPGPADPSIYSEFGIPTQLPVVAMIANVFSYKGHADLVKAAALLEERGLPMTLFFVGRPDDSMPLPPLAQKQGLERVVYAGARMDVARLLRVADVVVSASHEEGFSNSILEAMSTGKPVVATAVGGTVEQIVDGASGLLVPPSDPSALADAIARLLVDPPLRQRIGAAARAAVLQNNALDTLFENTRRLYRRLLLPEPSRAPAEPLGIPAAPPTARARAHRFFLTTSARLLGRHRKRWMYAVSYVLGRTFGQSGDVVVRTPDGIFVQVGLADAYWISFFLKESGYEPDLQRFFEQLQPGPTLFVDCGANNGWWSLAAEKRFRWTPIAVEPAPERVALMRRNRELNDCSFEIIQAAVWSDSSRTLTFSTDVIDHAGGHVNEVAGNLGNWRLRDHCIVRTVTVDDIVERFMSSHGGWPGWRVVIKLDVEGAESAAMKGCARTLEHPNVFLVYEDHGGDPSCLPTQSAIDLGLQTFLLTERGAEDTPASIEILRASKKDVHRGYNLVAARDADAIRSATAPRATTPPARGR